MTMQESNLTGGGDGRQNNFGKAVSATASVKTKEMHLFVNCIFGVHHIYFYPDTRVNKLSSIATK